MKLFLLMWAVSPTDADIQHAYAYRALDGWEECQRQKAETYDALMFVDDSMTDHLFCITPSELNGLREMKDPL